MFRPILLIVLLMMLGACQPIEQAPNALHPGEHSLDATKPSAAGEGRIEKDPGDVEQAHSNTNPQSITAPTAKVDYVDPAMAVLAQTILSASRASMDKCRANSGAGLLQIRIVSSKKSANILIENDNKLGDDVRDCVIRSLSTIDVPDTYSNASPSMQSSANFITILTVRW